MSMAVLAKLHIAYQQYLDASKQFRRAQQVADVDQRLYEQIRNRNATDVGGDLERISAQVSAEMSQLQRYQSYAETQSALGRLYATMGIDPLPEGEVDTLDLVSLDRALRRAVAEHKGPSTTAETAGPSIATHAEGRPAMEALTDALAGAVKLAKIGNAPAVTTSAANDGKREPSSTITEVSDPH